MILSNSCFILIENNGNITFDYITLRGANVNLVLPNPYTITLKIFNL